MPWPVQHVHLWAPECCLLLWCEVLGPHVHRGITRVSRHVYDADGHLQQHTYST